MTNVYLCNRNFYYISVIIFNKLVEDDQVDDFTRVDFQNTKIPKMVRNRNIKVFMTAIIVFIFGVILLSSVIPDLNWFGIIISLAIIACALYGFYLVYSRTTNIYNYPAIKKFLAAKDSDSIIKLFINEMNSPATEFGFGFLTRGRITENFVIFESFYRFWWIHFTEIVWVYPKQTKKSVNLIPMGTTHGAVIYLSDGKKIELEFNSNDILMFSPSGHSESVDFLMAIKKIAPFAVYGYSIEIQSLWNHDRKKFIAEVQNRMLKLYA